MGTIEDKKTELFDELASMPGQIVTTRKGILDNALLATDMRDASTELTTDNLQGIMQSLGDQRTILKASNTSEQIKFNFQTRLQYQELLDFDLPEPNQFGYILIDDDGNTLSLTDTTSASPAHVDNFYLVRNSTTKELVSVDDDISAFVTPTLVQDVTEEVQEFKTESSNITFTLANLPIKKVSPGVTVTIHATEANSSGSEELIAEVDLIGTVTSLSNSKGIEIDESSSFLNYDNLEIDLDFVTVPVVETSITVKYDYAIDAITASETHTDFNSGTFIFSRTLSSTPIIDSFEVYLNDVKKAISNRQGIIYSMEVDVKESLWDAATNEARVKFNNVTVEAGSVARFDYIIENNAAADEEIGGFQLPSISLSSYTTQNQQIDLSSVRILFDMTEVATSDEFGNIAGSYSTVTNGETGTITGTIDLSGGLLLTFDGQSGGLAAPLNDVTINIVYDFASGLDTWLAIYDILSLSSLSINGNGLEQINLASSGSLSAPPALLKTYPIKRRSNHQIYGNLIVVSEGLEINADWLPVYIRNDGVTNGSTTFTSTDLNTSGFDDNQHATQILRLYLTSGTIDRTISSHTGNTIIMNSLVPPDTVIKFEIIWAAEDSTLQSDASFKTFLTWLDPSRTDDILASANPNNLSDGSISNGSSGVPLFPNVEQNPFYPALDGTHEANQPGSLTLNDPFAGYYFHDETDKYDINSDIRWLWGPEPPEDSSTFTDIVATDMAAFRDLSFSAVIVIPADDNPDFGDTYYLDGGTNLIIYTDSSGPPETFVCKYNDVQLMLNDGTLKDTIDNLDALRTAASGGDGFEDPNEASEDRVWWDTVESISNDLNALISAHTTWRGNYIPGDTKSYAADGNPSALATTFQDALGSGATDFYNVCFESGTGRIDVIEARAGNPVTAGYVKDIYDLANIMAGKNVGYVRDVYSDLFSTSAFYDRINSLRIKYRAYEDAIPN